MSAIFKAGGIKPSAAMEQSASLDDYMAMQAAPTMPEGVPNFVPPEPTTFKKAKASPELPHSKGGMGVEMLGLAENRVRDQVPSPGCQDEDAV